jgi:SpoVK/Ycf46/Vps4 family AAA+-type ATPase
MTGEMDNNQDQTQFDVESLRNLLSGETLRLAQQSSSIILAKYGPIASELKEVLRTTDEALVELLPLAVRAQDELNPDWMTFNLSKQDMTDLRFFQFFQKISSSVLAQVLNSRQRLTTINNYATEFLPLFEGKVDFGALATGEATGARMMNEIQREYEGTVLNFDKLLAAVYLNTRQEYKYLRRKFLGSEANTPEKDDLEEHLMSSLFGFRPPAKPDSTGAPIALIDDNCVLTQVLMDLSDNVPAFYKKIMPSKNGKRSKTVKHLDAGEVEDFAQLLIAVSHPKYLEYISQPNSYLATIMETLEKFYELYKPVATAFHNLLQKLGEFQGVDKMATPQAIARQYSRINFLAIRPDSEDIEPKTKVERDYGIARTKLLKHLNETLSTLSSMNRRNVRLDTELDDYAVEQTKLAVNMKTAMVEVQQSERKRQLTRNIREDNEFYVSRTGNLGSLEVEREPAPRITYNQVVGATFIKAKEHVEEVVKVASHAHVMRVSAPRGDIKSNLMLIGPYGCGKTEMAKAIGADPRIIGFNVTAADLLTAYMHESVKNVKRLYDHAKDLRQKSRFTKPVAILLDEFDRLFSYGEGVHQAYDGKRMEGVFQEMMDGVVGYEGVFLVALTNIPKQVPEAILRRFKYVDVVGQLTKEERASLFKQFLTKGLPVADDVTETSYLEWADRLEDAPGDVLGKVADEVHFKFMKEFVDKHGDKVSGIERRLSKRLRDKEIEERDRKFLRDALKQYKIVGANDVSDALDMVIKQPQIQMQINKAKQVYRDAGELMQGLSSIGGKEMGFGGTVKKRSALWSAE